MSNVETRSMGAKNSRLNTSTSAQPSPNITNEVAAPNNTTGAADGDTLMTDFLNEDLEDAQNSQGEATNETAQNLNNSNNVAHAEELNVEDSDNPPMARQRQAQPEPYSNTIQGPNSADGSTPILPCSRSNAQLSRKAPRKTAGKAPRRAAKKSTARKAPSNARQTTGAKAPLPARRQYRFKPGTRALKEIRKFQKGGELILPRAPFTRVVKEIMHDNLNMNFRIQREALGALQEASEAFLVSEFEICNWLAIHGKRITIQPKDMQLTEQIRRAFTGECYYKALERPGAQFYTDHPRR